VDERRQQRGARYDPLGTGGYGAKDAVDQRIEKARVRHHAEEEDREHEHRHDRSDALDARRHELADLGTEAGGERCPNRHHDERDERSHLAAGDRRQQDHDRQQAEQSQHPARMLTAFGEGVAQAAHLFGAPCGSSRRCQRATERCERAHLNGHARAMQSG
jgi:hypothetical protein